MWLMASSTQSVGVPSTAKTVRLIRRMRSGQRMVSEWLTALCSSSGATTHTSRDSERATRSSTLRPVERIPSSLVTRMRAFLRSSGGLNIAADDVEAAHVGTQRRRHLNGAVAALVILHHRDQCPADRNARPVEGVHELRALLAGATEARVHAPSLKVAEIGARRDLAIGVLARQPDLDVVGLARGESHVARAQQHDPVRYAKALEHFLRARGHALVLFFRFVRMRDRHQLDLVELV